MIIYKYPIPSPGISKIKMPNGARVLSVGMQNDTIVVWAEVNPLHYSETYTFLTVNTGEKYYFQARDKFLGTVTSSTGIVWHVFQIGEGE